MSTSEQLHPHFSVEDIARIMNVLIKHGNEEPCCHSHEEIMREAFEA